MTSTGARARCWPVAKAGSSTVCRFLWTSAKPSSSGCATRARGHRHLPVKVQHAALTRRLVGHFNYFGVNGNHRSLARVVNATQRVWRTWLRRPSQRTLLTWERFNELLKRFPFPRPRVVVRIWGA